MSENATPHDTTPTAQAAQTGQAAQTAPARARRRLLLVGVVGLAGVVGLFGCTTHDRVSEENVPPTDSVELRDIDDDRPSTTSTTSRRKKDRPSTTTTTKKKATTTTTTKKPTTTTTTEPDEEECESYSDTRYLPARSAVTFERNGVSVDVQRVWHRNLTLEVTSSDGKYRHTRVDPDTVLYEGLVVTTSNLHLDWVWDYFKEEFVMEPGQVNTVLRVYDCWTYTHGPDDLW